MMYGHFKHSVVSERRWNLLSCLTFILLFVFCQEASAQKRYRLSIQYDSVGTQKSGNFHDSLSAAQFVSAELYSFIAKGHLEASVDQRNFPNDSTAFVNIHTGPVYHWAKLDWAIEDPVFRKPSGWNERWQGKKISIKNIQKQKKKLLRQATSRGYPFTSVYFDEIKIAHQEFNAKLKATKGPFITMDDITVEGERIVSDNRIWHYVLDMKKGSPFIADKIVHIDDRINELPFAETSSPSGIIFKEDNAGIKLFLRKKKSNHFDLILGLQPVSSQSQAGSILTGQVTADMYNMLSYGERIFFDYKRFNKEDQNVQLGLSWPFLPGTRTGADGSFQLQKRDTSHLDIQYNVGAKIPLKRRSNIKVLLQENISNILSVNETAIKNSGKLPAVLDYRLSSFGIEGAFTTLDFLINPTNGWDLKIKALAGRRIIRKNQKIIELSRPGADFNAQYDSIRAKTGQFRLDFSIEKYTSVSRHQVLKTGLQSGSILFSANTLKNELYRIGGYRLLRGFDEQSLEVSKYIAGTIEYRYLLSTLSYAFVFTDIGFTNTQYGDINFNDQTTSFGLGMTLQTKAGLFGIAAAVGQRKGLPFDFRSPKVHFGYVSVF